MTPVPGQEAKDTSNPDAPMYYMFVFDEYIGKRRVINIGSDLLPTEMEAISPEKALTTYTIYMGVLDELRRKTKTKSISPPYH